MSQRSAVLRFLYLLFVSAKHLGAYALHVVFKPFRRGGRNSDGLLSNMPSELRLRLFLQEVDGAVIKLGQILAMRVDFLPEAYVQELVKLLDEVPAFSWAEAREIIEKELGAPVEQLFRTFETETIAAASFGQAYAATLQDGEEVVVKVQRPGIRGTVLADLKLFRVVVWLIDATGITQRTMIQPVFEEFRDWTKEELDYRIEGSHVQEIYDSAAGSTTQKIPKVYWDHTSARVLTLERLRGLWVKEIMQGLYRDRDATIESLSKLNTNLDQVSQHLLRNTLQQIFVYGVYHADPHAGNILVMENGGIGYVDFGITGRIGGKSKESQLDVHEALESGDFDRFYPSVLETLNPPYDANLTRFERDVKRAYTDWLIAQSMGKVNITEKSFARLMLRINNAAQRNGLAFKNAEVRIFRALATVDAVLLHLAPALDLRGELRRFFVHYRLQCIVTEDIPALVYRLPDLLRSAAASMEKSVLVRTTHVNQFRRTLAAIFQTLSIALIFWGLVALAVPSIAPSLLLAAQVSATRANVLFVGLILMLAWLSRLLKLRSVVYRTAVEDRPNGCR